MKNPPQTGASQNQVSYMILYTSPSGGLLEGCVSSILFC